MTVTGPNGETALLHKVGREWGLSWKPSTGPRARWGNAQEIREDIDEFERTGTVAREPQGWA